MVAAPEKRIHLRGELAHSLMGWLEGRAALPVPVWTEPFEILAEGPAGTGKTFCALYFWRLVLERYPKTRILFMRQNRVDMTESFLVEWEESVLGPGHPCLNRVITRGGRDTYDFPNGSQVVLVGFNNPTGLRSAQYHGVYFNELNETTEERWESLYRALRAPGGPPFRLMVGDVNPGWETDWYNLRCDRGIMRRIRTRPWDNPRFFAPDETGRLKATDEGRGYYAGMLRNTSGERLESLYWGRYSKPEGMMLPEYDPGVHEIDGRVAAEGNRFVLRVDGWDPVELKWFFGSMDQGFNPSPGVLQVWGVDAKRRRFRVYERYQTEWTPDEWSREVAELNKRYPMVRIVSDHDKAQIEMHNRALAASGDRRTLVEMADKTMGKGGKEAKRARIGLARAALHRREVFFLSGAVERPDQALLKQRRPWKTEKEIPLWVRVKHVRGEDPAGSEGEPDNRCADHGIDAWLYGEAYFNGQNYGAAEPQKQLIPGTIEWLFAHSGPQSKTR